MAHTNALAMTFEHPLYQQFKSMQVIDPFGRPLTWGLDMDGDWLPEPYFAYINPGYREWTELMTSVIGNLISSYGVDGVFLDQTLLAFNVSHGPNFIRGMGEHIRKLQQAFPDTLFAGEGMHEHLLGLVPMAQIHGIDSLLGAHGAPWPSWRQVHPVSSFLFGDYVRLTAHLLTRHPSHPLFQFQEDAYARLNVMPALCLYHWQQKMDSPQLQAMLERAQKLASRRWDS